MLYCKNADCGVYLGSMGADSCALCGHVDQDAIESAACADRDARIAELEQRNADLHEDVKRFRNHALNEKDARMVLEQELAEVRKDERNRILDALKRHDWNSSNIWRFYYPSATGDWVDLRELRKLLEPTIDAAMKGTP